VDLETTSASEPHTAVFTTKWSHSGVSQNVFFQVTAVDEFLSTVSTFEPLLAGVTPNVCSPITSLRKLRLQCGQTYGFSPV
jgi:hypothetical protein